MTAKPLAQTVALVTGASSGIGAATARTLAAAGSRVVIAARRRERLDALAADISAAGGDALVCAADITDAAQARALVDFTVERCGRLDTLVNNAGVMLLGPIVGSDLREWERMLRINLDALLHCTHAALPHLLRAAESEPRRVADIVNISSVAGRVARSGSGVYNATKWGVNAFTESLRQEVTRRHVRVSVVEPGAVETELAEHNRPEIQAMIKRVFNIERLRAEDIADAVAYVVTRARHIAVNEVLIRPTEQE
jgi:NADP-dependent 3-hydroxy acid dehydrogenase YdfG